MMKPITGQYECVHSSGIGLDYFTSRIDRLIVQANGRFSIVIQSKSRAANAAQSLVSGQQITSAAPETRREGCYSLQDASISLTFDDGAQEQGQLLDGDERIQIGANVYTRVSDSTLLPPTNRLQKDMDDIARGLKIASTIGGFALKAAKGIQSTIQSAQSPDAASAPAQPSPVSAPPAQPAYQGAPQQPRQAAPPPSYQPPPAPPSAPPTATEAIFCDQCGNRCRPGKRFCGNCGNKLY